MYKFSLFGDLEKCFPPKPWYLIPMAKPFKTTLASGAFTHLQVRAKVLVVVLTMVIPLGGCKSSKVVLLQSQTPATVSIHKLNSQLGLERIVGKTPVEVSKTKMQDRIVKIDASGFVPMYVLVTDGAANKTNLNVSLIKKELGTEKNKTNTSIPKTKTNTYIRLLLSAYKELSSNDPETAFHIAQKAERVAPTLAAASIIKGLAKLRQGEVRSAKKHLKTAAKLDPSDTSIQKILDGI
jgi:hypothetical protein